MPYRLNDLALLSSGVGARFIGLESLLQNPTFLTFNGTRVFLSHVLNREDTPPTIKNLRK